MIKFENKENGRYYYLITHRDLLNDYVITVNYGGAFNHRTRHIGFASRDMLEKEIKRITTKRLHRGYTVVA